MINIERLKSGLEVMADKEIQLLLWTAKLPGQMLSFDETIATVFDDSGLAMTQDATADWIALPVYFRTKVEELDQLLRHLPEHLDPEEIVASPTMIDVRRVSTELIGWLSENGID